MKQEVKVSGVGRQWLGEMTTLELTDAGEVANRHSLPCVRTFHNSLCAWGVIA